MSSSLAVLAAVLLMRLAELAFSGHQLRRDVRSGRAKPIPEPLYPAMVFVHALWFLSNLAEVYWLQPMWQPGVAVPMAAMWGGALGLRLWMMLSMGRLWNVRLIDRREQRIVTTGPYRFVRHPNYLAVVLEIAAVPLLLGAYFTAAGFSLANALVLWKRIAREEEYLASAPDWQKHFRNKKRFVPGLF